MLIFLGFVFSGMVAHADVVATDHDGNSVSLAVLGGKATYTVTLKASVATTFEIKLFASDSFGANSCSGQNLLGAQKVLSGPSVDWVGSFAQPRMGGSVASVTACLYNVVDGHRYLMRVVSDSDYLRGLD
jgi:hypothetical protein